MGAPFVLDKDESHIHTGNETERRRSLKVITINKATNYEQWTVANGQLAMDNRWKEGEDGCSMDRQYEYFSSGVSHRHGFLSHRSGEYVDSVAKKRIRF